MVEIKQGFYFCPRFGFGINIPADLSEKEINEKLLEQSARIVGDILEECHDLGRIYHDPYCPANCPVQNLIEPLNELLRTKK